MKSASKYTTSKLKITLCFLFAYLFGFYGAAFLEFIHPKTVAASAEGNWGLSFQEDVSSDILAQYNAYYAEMTDEKVLYLTFDAGYENGHTPMILDALKKHQVPATFFVVGNYLEREPELIKRMVNEGHIVGNHTYSHPDMSKISTVDAFSKELSSIESLYHTITGKSMKKYYRPPQGKYSTSNLQMAKELGYTTFFWSVAYVDWYVDDQPSHEEALKTILSRIHPGAIILLHSTSCTNAQILDTLLTQLKSMDYQFKTLDSFIK